MPGEKTSGKPTTRRYSEQEKAQAGFAVRTAQRSGLRTRRQVNGTTAAFTFGTAGEVPLVGDWNADRISTPDVFHDGQFSLRNQNTGGAADITFTYGNVGDILVVGD